MTSINRDSSIIVTGISYRWHFLWGILLKFLLISLFLLNYLKFLQHDDLLLQFL